MGLEGDFHKLSVLIDSLEKLSKPSTRKLVVASIAEEYRSFMTERFRAGESPYGQPWEPLKLRGSVGGRGQIPLSDTGIMRGAITPRDITLSGFRVVVGRIYASVHQYGAVIRPRAAKALRFRGTSYVKTGKSVRRKLTGWIFARKVVIPARPFLPLSGMPAELGLRIRDAADEAIREILGK